MQTGTRLALYGVMLFIAFSLVYVATAMDSAIPLFFAFIPALIIMMVEKSSQDPR